jgi:hypothetical protein
VVTNSSPNRSAKREREQSFPSVMLSLHSPLLGHGLVHSERGRRGRDMSLHTLHPLPFSFPPSRNDRVFPPCCSAGTDVVSLSMRGEKRGPGTTVPHTVHTYLEDVVHSLGQRPKKRRLSFPCLFFPQAKEKTVARRFALEEASLLSRWKEETVSLVSS